jgi:hypothetical protein
MAATSAIADANSETLTQALRTATMASSLKNSTIGLIDQVAEDRKAYQLVMQEVVQQVNDAKAELNKAVERTKGMHGASVRPKRGRKTSVEATVREAGSPHYIGTPIRVG